jgi:phage-related protein
MEWKIEYYSEKVAKTILKMPSGLLARYIHVSDMMLSFGPNLGMPHTRAMGERLFEIRLKSKEGISRIFYCTKIRQRIIMLHMFIKKSEKTPEKELRIARERLQEVIRNEP